MFREPIVFRFSAFLVLGIWGLVTVPSVFSQTDAEETPIPQVEAGESQPKPEVRFSIGWVSTIGNYTYVPQYWGDLHINLINLRDVPRELSCMTKFDEQPTLQFGRRVWLPPRSKLQISHPVLIPKIAESAGRTANLHSLILDSTSSNDLLVKNESGQLLHDGALLVTHALRNTGIIGQAIADADVPPPDVLNLVQAGRASQELSSKISLLFDDFLTADPNALRYLDHIVVWENRIADDFAALSALRQWVHAGGHLWIMLDCVDPVILERLFGDDFTGYLVDRVGLTSVRIDRKPSSADPEGVIGETVEHEDPVQMARIVVQNMEVANVVNGWPAALTRRYGDGRILVTALGPRGWLSSGKSPSRYSRGLQVGTANHGILPLYDVATGFFGAREPAVFPQRGIEPQVREYIGYTVPSWSLIVGTLIGFSASLVTVGIWLLRAGRLERLGGIGSAMAIAVSVFLLLVGRSFRHGIPATIASVQIAQALSGTDDVQIQGLIAVYHPEGSHAEIEATRGGRMLPEMTGVDDFTRRMVTTDLGKWHWENLAQPAGLRVTSFTQSETVIDRMEAHATFNASGMTGSYSGSIPPGTDALVATRSGRIGVALHDDGSFTARAEDVFDKDQYLGASLLGDEQDRRRRTLARLFENPERGDYPERPQLMFWSEKWGHGFEFGDNLKKQSSTLVALPLVIHRPANGTEIVVPSPLLTYRNRIGPDRSPPAAMWDYKRKEWQPRADPGSTWLSFQVPRELLPLTATRARIEIEVSGPVGLIEILGVKQGAITSLRKILDPVGSLSIDIDDAEALTIDDDGTISLNLIAGDPARPELTRGTPKAAKRSGAPDGKGSPPPKVNFDEKVNYWKIESLKLQLWAKTTEPTAKD